MPDTAELYNFIAVSMTLTFIQGNRVTRQLELTQSFSGMFSTDQGKFWGHC